jgi:2-polyprenyl-3-methyl-5-hydroxy-6-metoxy-1,4-benzoquinol methylase
MMETTVSTETARVRYAASIVGGDTNDPRILALNWVRPGSRVLEIGCGHGAVTRLLVEKLRCTVVACDFDADCEQDLAGVAERFVCGDIDDEAVLSALGGPFDFILLMDVLEHLPRPAETLQRIRARVAGPTTGFVVTLPNFLVWHVRVPIIMGRFQYEDSGTLDRTHLRFFSPESAQELLREGGLEVADSNTTWNIPLLGPAWVIAHYAEDPQVPGKAMRRFPKLAHLVPSLVRAHRKANALGWTSLLALAAKTVQQSAPAFWTNHIVMLGIPAESAP